MGDGGAHTSVKRKVSVWKVEEGEMGDRNTHTSMEPWKEECLCREKRKKETGDLPTALADYLVST